MRTEQQHLLQKIVAFQREHVWQRLAALWKQGLGQSQQRTLNILLLVLHTVALVSHTLDAAEWMTGYGQSMAQDMQARIVPNVFIQGVPVGGLTPEEARAAVYETFSPFLEKPVTFELKGATWQPRPEELGFAFEVDTAIDHAYALGHTGYLHDRLGDWWQSWQQGYAIPLKLVVDETRIQAYLLEIAYQVEQSPQDAVMWINAGAVHSTPARNGQQLLIDAMVPEVILSLQTLQPQQIGLAVRELQPALNNTGIAEAYQYVHTLLQAPLTLTAQDGREWQWSPTQLAQFVQLSQEPGIDPGQQRITASLDQQRIRAELDDIADELNVQPIEPRVQRITETVQIVQQGQDGVRLNTDASFQRVMQAFREFQRHVELPIDVQPTYASTHGIGNIRITGLVAKGQSSFAGSEPYRIQNIQAGARRMHGILIPPGAEFSFNEHVGAVDQSNGFTQGYAIIDGRTQLEWGGGLCQVSTTVFRAAFWAGLGITERNEHAFRIFWYETLEPIGMDAAIFTGPYGYDLRFVNDTGQPMVMETEVDTINQIMTVYLYGTPTGREVIQMPPQISNQVAPPAAPRYVDDPNLPVGMFRQTDVAIPGLDVHLQRIVKNPDGSVLHDDTFFSRFEPWPNVYVRGTGY
ncbi:MAG: vanomycin resistance protein VanB [Chloroflexaceae bacterium]|nr:vanomycin resistance protein VanB [Chloroflexaceae bacterium]